MYRYLSLGDVGKKMMGEGRGEERREEKFINNEEAGGNMKVLSR